MAVIDIVTFNGEFDLLEIRLNILNDLVDEFVIVEAPTTFSGKQKPLYYLEQEKRYDKWKDKIKYYVVNEADPDLWALAKNSPNTHGADHWKREFVQKESIKKALTHLDKDDFCFVGDVDEIWTEDALNIDIVQKLKLKVYTYNLNNRSNEQFWGTIVAPYWFIEVNCLNHIRTHSPKTQKEYGWHFTSMGGYDEVKRKLTDSYTADSYADSRVMKELESAIRESRDFLGRGFTYKKDESEWPKYLKDNRGKYKHLMR